MGRFSLIGKDGEKTPLTMAGLPRVSQSGTSLRVTVSLAGGGELAVLFQESQIVFSLSGTPAGARLGVVFQWVGQLSAFQSASANVLNYRFRNFDYSVRVVNGVGLQAADGVSIVTEKPGPLRLLMAQRS